MTIALQISLPDRLYISTKADKVILPVLEGNLTVVTKRAPRSQLLTSGMIALLNEDNKITQRWHIEGGIAEIANDMCQVAVENIKEIL